MRNRPTPVLYRIGHEFSDDETNIVKSSVESGVSSALPRPAANCPRDRHRQLVIADLQVESLRDARGRIPVGQLSGGSRSNSSLKPASSNRWRMFGLSPDTTRRPRRDSYSCRAVTSVLSPDESMNDTPDRSTCTTR